MRLCPDPEQARLWCGEARRSGLGFVPTMGALHAGHLALVRRSVGDNADTCVSIFVNPLQFDDPRDLERYPRDLEGDARLLRDAGCSMVFTGTLAQFFPEYGAHERIPARDPGPWAQGLEGNRRPGHFAGVATIVARLFEIVRPDRAYFGEKDYQQTRVVADLARELGYPEVIVCPTEREGDGLALSSRNVRLTESGRQRARAVPRALALAKAAWGAGERSASALRRLIVAELEGAGMEVEYAEVRDTSFGLAARSEPLEQGRALVAVRVGDVRLIDNLALDGPWPESLPKP